MRSRNAHDTRTRAHAAQQPARPTPHAPSAKKAWPEGTTPHTSRPQTHTNVGARAHTRARTHTRTSQHAHIFTRTRARTGERRVAVDGARGKVDHEACGRQGSQPEPHGRARSGARTLCADTHTHMRESAARPRTRATTGARAGTGRAVPTKMKHKTCAPHAEKANISVARGRRGVLSDKRARHVARARARSTHPPPRCPTRRSRGGWRRGPRPPPSRRSRCRGSRRTSPARRRRARAGEAVMWRHEPTLVRPPPHAHPTALKHSPAQRMSQARFT